MASKNTMGKRRVIALIDMDCFYVQVEQRNCPDTKGKPCAVVQYKTFRGGSIIAVSYEARALGVSRQVQGNDARKVCPDIHLFRVPEKRGKADLTKYRDASQEVMDIILSFTGSLERASIDEAFVDLTDLIEQRMERVQKEGCFKLLSPDTMVPHYSQANVTMTTPVAIPTTLHQRDSNTFSCSSDSLGVKLQDENVCQFDEDSKDSSKCDHMFTDPEDSDSEFDKDWFSLVEPQNTPQETSVVQDDVKGSFPIFEDLTSEQLSNSQEEKVKGLHQWLEGEGSVEEYPLAVGAIVVKEIRRAIFDRLGFTCSAGIASNKMLAKLAAGMNKPNGQTIIPKSSVDKIFAVTPIRKVRNLGGKFGKTVLEGCGVEFMKDLQQFNLKVLTQRYGEKSGVWLHNVCHGVDHEPIRLRHLPKSISAGKNFMGKEKLLSQEKTLHWLGRFAEEVIERSQNDTKQNHRVPTLYSVYCRYESGDTISRSGPLTHLSEEGLVADSWRALQRGTNSIPTRNSDWIQGITCLGMAVTRFQPQSVKGVSSTLFSYYTQKDDVSSPAGFTGSSCSPSHSSALPDHKTQKGKKPNWKDLKCFFNNGASMQILESREPSINDDKHDGDVKVVGTVGQRLSKALEVLGIDIEEFNSLPEDIKKEICENMSHDSVYLQTLAADRAKQMCQICKKEVEDMQVHSDFHFAMTLSNQIGSGIKRQSSSDIEQPSKRSKHSTTNLKHFFKSSNHS